MKNSSPEIVSIVVFNSIKDNYQLEYENWQNRIGENIKEFDGFIGISNKKLAGANNEYFTIFQFDSSKNINRWQNSDILNEYLNELKDYSTAESKVSQHEGLEIFFDKTDVTKQSPPFYKKVIIAVIAVYPLIIFIGRLYNWLNPWAEIIPFEIGLLFQVIIVSALMTYPVMPALAKLFNKWLNR